MSTVRQGRAAIAAGARLRDTGEKPRRARAERAAVQARHPGSFFVSSRIHTGGEAVGGDGFVPGEAHYSYGLARSKFLDLLRSLNYQIQILARPELFFSEVSHRGLKFPLAGTPHLIFKPFEHIRLLKGARNIACLAWEFDRLLTAETAKEPLLPMEDYVQVAQKLDEIWTPSRFTRDTFARHGFDRCHIIPAPIADHPVDAVRRRRDVPPVLLTNFVFGGGWYQPRMLRSSSYMTLPEVLNEHYGGRRPKVLISVFNPADWRKNPGPMLRAFLAFHQLHPDTLLIVKFVSDPSLGHLEHILDHHIRIRMQDVHHAFSFAIWVTDEFLPVDTYRQLLGFADYYVCTSYCEGQNLPLQEAMNCGVVPVSVAHTAMADYLHEQNAIVIPSKLTALGIEESSAKRIHGARWFGVSDTDVFQALIRARSLAGREYDALSAAARLTVQDQFGYGTVARLIENRLAGLRAP
ncbi:MAG: hypothetical protein JO047_15765 [Alphaproteobacteria bacterium]|nr:hypothetical protein [Alphaproteobacteria bacterium]